MTLSLGAHSEAALEGVDARLVQCVRRAIVFTSVDFQVFEGLRSAERQRELYRNGASRTLNSRHLVGQAVDLVPVVAGRLQWQLPLCVQVAIAMREAAMAFGVVLTWGAVWDSPLKALRPAELEREVQAYAFRYRKQHHDPDAFPLIDGPHFQIELSPFEANEPT